MRTWPGVVGAGVAVELAVTVGAGEVLGGRVVGGGVVGGAVVKVRLGSDRGDVRVTSNAQSRIR